MPFRVRKDHYKDAETTVFWNVEDFPIPPGRDLDFFKQTIKSALQKEDLFGDVSFKAYGVKDYFDGSIPFVTERDELWRLRRMLIDMHLWTLANPSYKEPKNLLVLAKNCRDGIDMVNLLEMFICLHYNVLLVLPRDLDLKPEQVPQDLKPEQVPIPKVCKAWFWETLLDGGKPIGRRRFVKLLARTPREPNFFNEK